MKPAIHKFLPVSRAATPSALLMMAAGFLIPAITDRMTRSVIGRGYMALTHEDPPKNPADPSVRWSHAIVWTAMTGAIGGMARMVARRLLVETSIPAEGYDMEAREKALLG